MNVCMVTTVATLERNIHHSYNVALIYIQKGQPTLLIHSGTHGDESDVIVSIEKYLREHADLMPDFLWIPEVSPSAVRAGTRKNERGVDVNRVFDANSIEPEVLANIALTRGKLFDLFLDIHEDPTTDAFYMYDSIDARGAKEMRELFSRVKALGVPLYNGLDDEDLGLHVADGYVVCNDSYASQDKGTPHTSWNYLREHGMVKRRYLTPEIPGKAPQSVKDAIVAAVFQYLIMMNDE